jgi:hypothetical protein
MDNFEAISPHRLFAFHRRAHTLFRRRRDFSAGKKIVRVFTTIYRARALAREPLDPDGPCPD